MAVGIWNSEDRMYNQAYVLFLFNVVTFYWCQAEPYLGVFDFAQHDIKCRTFDLSTVIQSKHKVRSEESPGRGWGSKRVNY